MLKKKARGVQIFSVCDGCKKKTNILYDGKNGKKICDKCLKRENNE